MTTADDKPLSVTALLAQLKRAVEVEVGEQSVVGEVGSFKVASSGHVYFTLKDAAAQLACVLYRFQAAGCRVALREGLQVELRGRATVWEGRGSLQFIVSRVKEAGIGSLQQRFELLKQKLASEGLFDQSRKRSLPRFPRSVGLITSASGAVIQDMRHRLSQRAPWVQAYLLPVQVQGKGAEHGLARAVQLWGQRRGGLPAVDYLIIARGGGSLEDLWCFNEEVLARAIAACPIPVVSAVGHETDFTIADFVADLRAPTPTAAIELTTPDAAVLSEWLDATALDMKRRLTRAVETARLKLKAVEYGYLRRPLELLAPHARKLDALADDLQSASTRRMRDAAARLHVLEARLAPSRAREAISRAESELSATQHRITSAAAARLQHMSSSLQVWQEKLSAASPQDALKRGFALVRTPDGKLARRAAEVPLGAQLELTLSEGSLQARVTARGADPAPHQPLLL